jgi:hypothetical protein
VIVWSVADEAGRHAVLAAAAEGVVVQAMRRHTTVVLVQEHACGVLAAELPTRAEAAASAKGTWRGAACDAHSRAVQEGAVAAAVDAMVHHPTEWRVQRRASTLLAALAAADAAVGAALLETEAPRAAVEAIRRHPRHPTVMRAACSLLLAAWPFEPPSRAEEQPTGGVGVGAGWRSTEAADGGWVGWKWTRWGGDAAASGLQSASHTHDSKVAACVPACATLAGRAIEAIIAAIHEALDSRPTEEWFVEVSEGAAAGPSLALAIEPAHAVLARMLRRPATSSGAARAQYQPCDEGTARAALMVTMGITPALTETLNAATVCGFTLIHGQELGGLLADPGAS